MRKIKFSLVASLMGALAFAKPSGADSQVEAPSLAHSELLDAEGFSESGCTVRSSTARTVTTSRPSGI
jgi:hypothetical protein